LGKMAERGNRKALQGVVVSDKMDKTVVVRVERLVKSRTFQKYVKRHTKFKAHDEGNRCTAGDKVLIVESRPLSRDKRWRVREIIEKVK